ncbi:MAG: hypothetical protein P4L46_04210 [Fimbriimonas sp.]|nr:hypothetical protein [Fimbriimonas sp.]
MATIDTIQAPTHGPLFDEQKSTELAAHMVLRCARRVQVWRLMAALYILDRRSIDAHGHAITEDDYIALPGVAAVPHGLTVHALNPSYETMWHHHLELVGRDIQYLATPDRPMMPREIYKIAERIVSDYAHLDDRQFKLQYFSEAPEAFVTEQRLFTQEHVMIALGRDPEEAKSIYEEWNAERRARHVRPHNM